MHFIPMLVLRNQLLCHPAISLLLYLNSDAFFTLSDLRNFGHWKT
jgi:hypothetical protein